MFQKLTRSWSQQKRHRVGMTLLIAGLIPWILLMGYIVYIRQPHIAVLFVTALAWMVFFVGKSLIKTVDRPIED